MSKWISVKRQKPYLCELVLMTDECEVVPGFYDADRGAWFETEGLNTSLEVTYWMPMPKPPIKGRR